MFRRKSTHRKIALVLGNSAYKPDRLPACRNDATDMSRALRRLGFEVIRGRDQTQEEMEATIVEFRQRQVAVDPDVAVIYYSGHGVQFNDTNFALPVDYSIEDHHFQAGLISLSDIISATTNLSKATLVFLDACRTNPFVEKINSYREEEAVAKGVETPAAISVGLAPITERQKLTSKPSFIAFAAAPGEVAWVQAGRRNSSFTESLLAHIETTDLSLDNLMTRVSSDVQAATDLRQEPWKLSSLTAPFYFAAGSLVWFNTNIVGFFAYLISMTIYTAALVDTQGLRFALPVGAIMLVALFLFLYGLNRSYGALRGDREADTAWIWRTTAIGGFFGGIIAAPLITTAYVVFLDVAAWGAPPPRFGQVLAEITCACVVCGTLLGPLGFYFAKHPFFLRIARGRTLLANTIGGAVGGLLTGLLTGPFVTAYFGSHVRPYATPEVLYPGGLVGAMLTIFVILNYRVELFSYRRMMARLLACFTAVVVVAGTTSLVFLLGYGIMTSLIDGVLGHFDLQTLVIAGLVAGPTVGIFLGAAVGLAFGLDRKFEKRWPTFLGRVVKPVRAWVPSLGRRRGPTAPYPL